MASTDARPVPQKNVAYRVTFPILDADGDLVTGATGLDSEVSKDAGTFTDCTNEATEIATSSGMYYLDLTSTEMNADCVAIIVKTSSSGAKTTPIVLYPEEAGDIRVNVTSYNGTAGTFSGGRPEVNVSHIAGAAVSTSTAQIGVNVVNAGGTAWGSGAITAASIAADAITDAKVASDVTIASVTGAVGSVTGNVGGNVVGSVASVTGAVGSVTGNVGGNVTGSVGSVTGLTTATISDKLLGRNVAGGADGTRTVSEALYVLRNKTQIAAGTLTVYGTDDATPAFTAAVTTTAGNPISAIDPA